MIALGRFRTAAWAFCGVAMLSTACGEDRPTEADLPAAAELAYPSAVETERKFDDGASGTFIDGSSASRAARLSVTYRVDTVTRDDLFDWYEAELVDRGWTIGRRQGEVLTAERDPAGELSFGYSVTAFDESVTAFVVRVAVASGDS